MNIFIREMRAHRKSLIIWSVGVLLMVGAGMSKFIAFSGTDQSINQLLNQMPKALQSFLGVGTLDLATASGYYGMLYLYLLLMTTIHAAMLGANVISKEERDKTAELLFVKPASRHRIITGKLAAALVNIVILNLVTLVSSIVIVNMYSKGEPVTGDIVLLMLGMLVTQLIFLGIGTGVAAVSKNPKISTSITTGILLVTFILSMAIDINQKLENVKYLTPFKYFDARNVLTLGRLEPVFIVLSILIIVSTVYVTYRFYTKRDLTI